MQILECPAGAAYRGDAPAYGRYELILNGSATVDGRHLGPDSLRFVQGDEPEAPARVPRSLRESVLDPLAEFFARDGAWLLLLLIVLYKLGDAFAGTLSTAFLLRGPHFSLEEVGLVNKWLGVGATILGALDWWVAAGERWAILGPSGSGKSTLVNLLARFYEPSDGAILIDQTDLREYNLAELRQQFSIVLQDPMLFSSTVAGNIAYANPQASRADVVRAAQLANAHEFIERLPQGYDTMIGDGGAGLSGGERQRLAIARAFLKDTPMLILDEPTSAVDVRTEQLIMEALDTLMAGRTTFMIAHRLSTLERCDMVLVLQNGSLRSVCTGGESRVSLHEEARVPARMRPVPRAAEMLTPGPVLLRMAN